MQWHVFLILLLQSATTLAWDPDDLTSQQILRIAPGSGTCDHARFADECVTAETATGYIRNAFVRYGIVSPSEQAAVISVMAYESEDFKLNRDHDLFAIGTGTRNMQAASLNQKYAASLLELRPHYRQAGNDTSLILDLLLSNPEWDFGSAAWYLTTQCNSEQRAWLQNGSDGAWEGYMWNCVGREVTPQRREYWNRAIYELVRSK